MIVKAISPGWLDGPMSRLADVGRNGLDRRWLTKQAAAETFRYADIKPKKGHSVIHVIALGDSDTYGANRNADLYYKSAKLLNIPYPCSPERKTIQLQAGNKERHHTFTKHAKVFREHANKNPKASHGDVLASAHNDAASRVELLIEVPDATWGDELEKLARGKDVPFSQACKVPHDICLYCGHPSRTTDDYCDHLKNQLGTVTKEGHFIGAANDWMTYFDISRVGTNADRIAFGLLKAASGGIVSGAKLAAQMGLTAPALPGSRAEAYRDVLAKLAAIEKQIEAVGVSAVPEALAVQDPRFATPDELRRLGGSKEKVSAVLSALADAKITLSIEDFLCLLLGPSFSSVADHVDEAKTRLPGIFGRLLGSDADLSDYEFPKSDIPDSVQSVIDQMVPRLSFADGPVSHRISLMIIKGKKPKDLSLSSEKKEKSSGVADALAEAYAKYKVVACTKNQGQEKDLLTKLAVLEHYTPVC